MMRIASRWLAPVVLGALIVAPATLVTAQDTPATPGQAAPHGSWLRDRLGLSDDQVQQIRTIHMQERQANKALYQQLGQARAQLRELALNGADESTLTAKRAEVEQLLGQTIGLQIDSLKKIGAILTPEQRAKFAQLRPGGRHHHRGMHAPAQS